MCVFYVLIIVIFEAFESDSGTSLFARDNAVAPCRDKNSNFSRGRRKFVFFFTKNPQKLIYGFQFVFVKEKQMIILLYKQLLSGLRLVVERVPLNPEIESDTDLRNDNG